MLMSEQVTDDLEGESALDKVCRQSMSEDMRAAPRRTDPRSVESKTNNAVHVATLAKLTGRSIVANEDLTDICTGPTAPKVSNQGAANRGGQRQYQRSRGLRALHPDDAGTPIDVLQTKINDLSSAKAIHGEEQEDRVIATAYR
jgi:hypothetical protein